MQAVTPVQRFGRVTRSTIDRLWAECFERDAAPPLGELVAVEDAPALTYAVVSASVTEGIDPSRRVTSHGGPNDNLKQVLEEHPHVPALMTTSFEAIVVGHDAGGRIWQYLPPTTAPILARIRACTDVERAEFMQSLDFLKLLLAAGPLADDVVASTLRAAAYGRPDGRAFLVRAGKALTPLLAADPTRLHAILRRLQP
ncbi:MAG: hypothetical protein ACYDCQ_22005 [Dehalococcoidia bacterium]